MKIILYHEEKVGLNKLRFVEHLELGITWSQYHVIPLLLSFHCSFSCQVYIDIETQKDLFLVFSQCRIID